MSTDLLIYHGDNVLTTQMNGETWWYLYEICDILGFDNYQTVINWLELIGVEICQTDSPGQKDVFIICQQALLDFLDSIHTPQARYFKSWVVQTAIPELDNYRNQAKTELLSPVFDVHWLHDLTALHERAAARTSAIEKSVDKARLNG